MSDKEINVVVWSGGLDSTLVLDQLCSSSNTIKQCIWAFTVNWGMLDDLKVKKEREVRKKYLSYAKKRGYNIAHQTITVKANMGVDHLGCAQGLAWFSYVIPYLPKNSILYLGYHATDEFWEYDTEFDNYVKAAAAISNRKITLSYPLKYMSKCSILEEFKLRKIPLSCVWTCEHPKKRSNKIVSCGKCNPCISLRSAVYESKLRKEQS